MATLSTPFYSTLQSRVITLGMKLVKAVQKEKIMYLYKHKNAELKLIELLAKIFLSKWLFPNMDT